MREAGELGRNTVDSSTAWLKEVARATRWVGLECDRLALGLIRIDLSFESIGHPVRMDGLWPSSAVVAAPMARIAAVFAKEGLAALGGDLDCNFLDAPQLEAIIEANKGSNQSGVGGEKAEICDSLAFMECLRNRANYKQAGLGELIRLDSMRISAMLVGSATAAPVSEDRFMERWEGIVRSILSCLGECAFVHMSQGFAPHLPSWKKSPDIWRAWPESLERWREIHVSMEEHAELLASVDAGNKKAAAPRI